MVVADIHSQFQHSCEGAWNAVVSAQDQVSRNYGLYKTLFFVKTNKLNKYCHEYTASSGEDEKRGGKIEEENVGFLKMFSFSCH